MAARWTSRYIWLGANDMSTEGRFVWVGTGGLVEDGFSDWQAGQPDNGDGEQHCVYAVVEMPCRTHHDDDRHTDRRRRASPGSEQRIGGTWDDCRCRGAQLNFVCEIVLQP